jgi:Arc/MetJ family transcription regulator
MRTNIVLDDDLLAQAAKYSSGATKRAVVQEALATYVAVKAQEQRTARYRDRLADARRRAMTAPIHSSAKDIVRRDRDRGGS